MNHPLRQRAAFAARDLVAALCVILLVFALLPVWLSKSTDIGSRQATCSNNLKNLALAMIAYESSRNHYPGYREDIDRTPAASPNDDRSWLFVVLPQLDNRALYDKYRTGDVPNEKFDANLDLLICPTLPAERAGPAANCYVANTGMLDGTPDATRPADFAANGVFHNRAAQASPDIPIVTVSQKFVAAGDGASTTLMLSENADAGRWSGGPQRDSPGWAPSERWMGFTWHAGNGQPGNAALNTLLEPLAINVRRGESRLTDPPDAALGFARPSSYHTDVVLAAFCDGRVRKINYKISYRVYQALMTPRGSEATDASTGQPLSADHAARKVVTEEEILDLGAR